MSALSEILNAVSKYGPEAAAALVRAGGRSATEIENALKAVGVTLMQSGNPAGKKILQGVGEGAAATQLTKQQRTPLTRARAIQEQRRQATRNLPSPAPKPQFQGPEIDLTPRRRGGDIVPQPRISPRRQVTGASEPVSRVGGSSEPYGFTPTRGVNVVDVTELNQPRLPMMTETTRQSVPRAQGFIPEGAQVFQPNLPNPRGPRGQFQSIYGEPKSVIEARQRMAVPVAPPVTRGPSVSPGQLSFDDLGVTQPSGPLSLRLAEQDPGTYQSVSDIALRASRALGRNISPEDLLGPQGTRLLSEADAIVRVNPPIGARRQLTGVEDVTGVRTGFSSDFYRQPRLMPRREAVRPEAIPSVNRVGFSSEPYAGANPLLRKFQSLSPARQIGLGLAAGMGGTGLVVGAVRKFMGPDGREYEVAVDPRTNQPLSDPAPAGSTDTSADATDLGRPPAAPTLPPPAGSVEGGVPGQTGPAVIRTNDGASNQRQAQANAIQGTVLMPDRMTGSAADYYAQRKAYVSQPGVRENIMERLVAMDARYGDPTSGLAQWAAANPTLAYELSQKSAPRDISQQSQNVQSTVITTPLGTNPRNNPIGNSVEAANVAVDGADPALRDATAPQTSVMLQKLPMPQEIRATQTFDGAQPGIADEFYNSVRGLRGPTGDFVRPNGNRLGSIIMGMG